MIVADDPLIGPIAREILDRTDAFVAGDLSEEGLPTSMELSKKLGIKLEKVKQRLKTLAHAGLVQAVTMSPKRYRFDRYVLSGLPEDDPFNRILGVFEAHP